MRQTLAAQIRGKLDTLMAGGWLSNDMRIAALDGEYRSRVDLAQLTAEQGALSSQISGLVEAVATADAALVRLRRLYADGIVCAPINGIVGKQMVENGTVLLPGQTLFELYQDERFVLAYLPTGVFFKVFEGEKVAVDVGLATFNGVIKNIEPVAATVPGEFQRAFDGVERKQLLRIRLDPTHRPPPLFTKVTVHFRWSLPWSN